MSIQAVAAVLALDGKVAGSRRLVLISLANHADQDGYCYPSRRTIGQEAGIGRLQTVTDCLGWLTEHGYIERAVNGWKGRPGAELPADKRPNLYRLLISVAPASGYTESVHPVLSGYTESVEGGYTRSVDPRLHGKRVPEPSLENHHLNQRKPTVTQDADSSTARTMSWTEAWAETKRVVASMGHADAVKAAMAGELDPTLARALITARESIRYGSENDAKFAFRDAYQQALAVS